ncbi:MAG: N-acetylmuramoyl-L-alanine amidase [Endomicrobium sp.]|jgi:N-acetylmuramoyl-L-alanine amidase|nr:N-acetylmuramoyl-L-alanine amidase [Endomicrobium sp.]
MRIITKLLILLLVLFVSTCLYAVKKEIVPSQPISVIVNGESYVGASVYKVSEKTKYFSVKEIAEIYNANLEWKPVSSQVVVYLNNRKIEIKANSNEVIFGRKLKKMSLPSRLIKNDIYIPAEILTSKEFSEIAEVNTEWNLQTLVLSINHWTNITAVKYFTKPESTQVIIQLSKALSYTVSKTSNSISIKILKGKVQSELINVDNGVIKNIQCIPDKHFVLVKINLEQSPKMVKTSIFSKPNRISVDIVHSQSVDVSSLRESAYSEFDEEKVSVGDENNVNLTLSEELRQSQISEIISTSEIDEKTKDVKKLPVKKFESNDIIDDSYMIVDDTATVVGIMSDGEDKDYKRKKLIVLDAGHGGEDAGAIGPSGTKEKDINLEIVYELKSIFDKDNDYEVILTRNDDTFIPLAERTIIANENSADLFISVHCNANFDRNIQGFEIYFLSENATDSEAAATATLENSVLELEGKSNKKRIALESIFWSMTVTEYMKDSSELSYFISVEANSRLRIPNRGVKQASFYVLRGSQMPSILVESAFLSNYAEEAKLCSKKFRIAVANSIYEGVVRYYARKSKE